jgi:hypothetical protein
MDAIGITPALIESLGAVGRAVAASAGDHFIVYPDSVSHFRVLLRSPGREIEVAGPPGHLVAFFARLAPRAAPALGSTALLRALIDDRAQRLLYDKCWHRQPEGWTRWADMTADRRDFWRGQARESLAAADLLLPGEFPS